MLKDAQFPQKGIQLRMFDPDLVMINIIFGFFTRQSLIASN